MRYFFVLFGVALALTLIGPQPVIHNSAGISNPQYSVVRPWPDPANATRIDTPAVSCGRHDVNVPASDDIGRNSSPPGKTESVTATCIDGS
jgi:hypothetical protein